MRSLKKFIYLTLIFITSVIFFKAHALEAQQFELSDPYLELKVDKTQVKPGEELNFTIDFANRGPQPAKELTIILNQPLDARSPLEFVSADPKPDDWLSSEFGKLAEFSVAVLETYEVTEGGKIRLTAKVRDSAEPQLLSPTASIQAPNREIGKQLIVSEAVETKIIKDSSKQKKINAKGQEETSFFQESENNTQAAEIEEHQVPSQTILASDAVLSTVAFLGISALIVASFFAGRKSKTS